MRKLLIDFEFTGLDNTFVRDNEIIQMKAKEVGISDRYCMNFGSNKDFCAHVQMEHGVKRYSNNQLFSKEHFYNLVSECFGFHPVDLVNDVEYFGWGIAQDTLMLNKYGIQLNNYTDIRELFQRSKEFEQQMALEGSSMEEVCFMAFGEAPKLKNHNGSEELLFIELLYQKSKDLTIKQNLEFVPFGHCKGMPIKDYVVLYRRQADGYRFNNSDLFTQSLDNAIYESTLPDGEDEGF